MKSLRKAYRDLGGQITHHDIASEIRPGIWLTGPIPRHHPERNWNPAGQLILEGETIPDDIPEDQALVIATTEGLVVISGCGHAGIINTLDYAKATTKMYRVNALLGGFHLINASDRDIAWTGGKLREARVQHVMGAHCTGINQLVGLRQAAGLDRSRAAVGAVGSTFELGKGINSGLVAR
jgi:7,8-dihydropterin-6-yl-methyl-4-(beta-D-ribofuranosyl)aminobenzene 5'-phosphate synthase